MIWLISPVVAAVLGKAASRHTRAGRMQKNEVLACSTFDRRRGSGAVEPAEHMRARACQCSVMQNVAGRYEAGTSAWKIFVSGQHTVSNLSLKQV